MGHLALHLPWEVLSRRPDQSSYSISLRHFSCCRGEAGKPPTWIEFATKAKVASVRSTFNGLLRVAHGATNIYSSNMIKSFQHKGLQKFHQSGSKAGIRPDHANKLKRQLTRLDDATCAEDMNIPGWGLHALDGDLLGHFAVSINGNWRMTFSFDSGDAMLVDYQDYH